MAGEGGGWDLSTLLKVLKQGEDRVRQLDACLDDKHSPPEQRKQLALQAQDAFQRAISMAQAFEADRLPRLQATADSPPSLSGRSDNSDRAFKEQERRNLCKKRKTLPKWTSQVRVALDAGGGATDCLNDGYCWRKYGQKEILGAKHPRGYFRCTHRNTAGCLAMKQVQRSDDDPSVFDVTYRGEHTCLQKLEKTPSSNSQEPGGDPNRHEQDHGLLLSFQTSLKVKTEGSSFEDGDRNSPFSFPSTPVSSFMPENNLFSSPPAAVETAGFIEEFAPWFIPPATSEPRCFSLSPWQMGGGDAAELADVVSVAATWASSSSAMDTASWGDPALPFDCFEHLFHDL